MSNDEPNTEPGVIPKVPNANDGETIARTLLERAPVLVYVVDVNFKVALMNRELREVTGWDTTTCDNVESLLEHFYPDEAYRATIRDIHEGWARVPSEQIRDTVMVLTSREGEQRSVSWTTARLRLGTGPVRGYIAVGVDVTTRRNLEHWVTLFQQSLLQMNEGLALVDPQGDILACSRGMSDALGRSEESLLGTSFRELLEEVKDEDAATDLLTLLGQGEAGELSLRLRHASGDVLDQRLQLHPIRGPGSELLADLLQFPALAGDPKLEGDPTFEDLATDLQEELTATKDVQSGLEAQLLTLAEEKAILQADLSSADQAKVAIEEELGAAEKAKTEAEDKLAAALAAQSTAETRTEIAEEEVASLRAGAAQHEQAFEAAMSGWQEEREQLIAKHIEDSDALLERQAEERALLREQMDRQKNELEEQLQRDILAVEERVEEKLRNQDELHQKARREWDDATAIAAHEMAEKIEAIQQHIASILQDRRSPDGSLPADALAELTLLLGTPQSTVAARDQEGDTHNNLEDDDLVLEDGGEEDKNLELDDEDVLELEDEDVGDDLEFDDDDVEPIAALDEVPPVSPVMVATASELEAHVPKEEAPQIADVQQEPETSPSVSDALHDDDLGELELDEPLSGDDADDLELELDEDDLESDN